MNLHDMNRNPHRRIRILLFLTAVLVTPIATAIAAEPQLHLLPYPKEVHSIPDVFLIKDSLTVVLDKNASGPDRFTAEELIRDLGNQWNIRVSVGNEKSGHVIVLTRNTRDKSLPPQGYLLTVSAGRIVVTARDEAGLFYGTRTLLQLIDKSPEGLRIPGITVRDWPDIASRAVHYDTKHHQDKASYVKAFIKDLASYKINMLVWEWEDKLAYPSHPEIGAPGAFTISEMQEFTRYARQYHIEIVPLVQGLGHVSFILKWPQYIPLREIPSSNWEFCPSKDASYTLLFDLWNDALEATPGSSYMHIGSDETYELGLCPQCQEKAKTIGRSGVYQLFVNKAADYLRTKKRKVMVWEPPMGWKMSDSPATGIEPAKGLVFTESYDYETPEQRYAGEARKLGFEVFAYDPNPGVVPLMVPYHFEQGEKGEPGTGCLEKSYRFLTQAVRSGMYNGMISTSWDDDGLHNQMWMLHFVNAAACSWNGNSPGPETIEADFYTTYYGVNAVQLKDLVELLNEGAYFYAWSMERNVWHYGEIGQTHLPDLPRGDALEYDPYWNTQYRERVSQSQQMIAKMDQALALIAQNKIQNLQHAYDLEIMRTSAALVKHTCMTYLDLSNLEFTIREAHTLRFEDAARSLALLQDAQHILENSLKRRETVFSDLVATYEVTRLPKGLSTPEKQFFHQQDRARHFAFRRPDMTFLIYDEQLLDIEGYLDQLKEYIAYFSANSMN
jgi:hexosaminidase